ncbi:MAG: phosphohistidine phosphatase SixA [Planctomycetes bacterium]|nr:phosphohistidine phosphatase SixA [Planctomycetota bacterium]
MDLYLLRHAEAYPREASDCPADRERPLIEKGEKEARRAAEAMARLEIDFELILSSPYRRARQTAEIVANILKRGSRLKFSDWLRAEEGDNGKLIEEIAAKYALSGSILLVGHEPNLSRLISVLLSGNDRLPLHLRKAGLCRLNIEELKHGQCARLEWLLTPKQLGRLAK